MQAKLKVALTGGGTAGHIIPTYAVKDELQKNNKCEFIYIGGKKSMEENFAEEKGMTFYAIQVGKVRRYFDLQNFFDPFKVIVGIFQSVKILYNFKPDVVFSKGGYVSVPVGIASWILRIPLVIHESDVIPGLSNKILAKCAQKVCVSFQKTLEYMPKAVFTGSPVREYLKPKNQKDAEIFLEEGYAFTGFDENIPVIFILGGSSGASKVTQKIYDILPDLKGKAQIILQTGKGKMNAEYNSYSYLKQYEYIGDEMKYLYSIADIIITRSGANTISELSLLRKASILIPLNAQQSRGDQIVNARMLEEKDAVFIHYDEEDSKLLLRDIFKLLKDPTYRRHLERNIEKFSPAGATEEIAKEILKVLG